MLFTILCIVPVAAALFTFVATVVLASLAGWIPGRVAGRLELTKAFEHE